MSHWFDLIEKHKKILIEASRDHYKSWTLSYSLPLFHLQKVKQGESPIHIAVISYSEKQAQKNLSRVRKKIESTPELKHLMPKQKSYVWDSRQLELSNECSLEAFGFGSSIRGGHFDWVIIDDACKDKGSGSMSVDEQVQFFYGVIIPALKKRGVGRLVITGNPVDKVDFLWHMEQNPEIPTFKFPAILDDGTPLCPEHYTVEDIHEKRDLIPPHIFAREYMLRRVSSADSLFKEHWIHYYTPPEIEGKSLYKTMTIDPVPPPTEGQPMRDALAAVVTGMDDHRNVYTLDRMAYRGEFREGINQLIEMMVRNEPDFIGIEIFAFQNMYKVWLEQALWDRDLPFAIHKLGANSKKKKAARILSLQPALSRGKVFFLKEHKPLIDQLLLWDPTSKTNDDDEIDALGYQVPLWQKPIGISEKVDVIVPGSFAADLIEVKQAKMGSDYLSNLFQEYMPSA